MRSPTLLAASLVVALLPASALASFHVMQIEQVIGGVDGDTSRQAVQLRMRDDFQNQVQQSRIVAWNAQGLSPVVLVDFTASVPGNALGSRVLVATAAFSSGGQGPAPDAVMTNPIPASYLPAGRITFEDDGGGIVFSLCWGGAGYTGSTAGSAINDNDGTYGPCFAGPLPGATLQALRFTGSATDQNTTNAASFALTAGAATFTNNANASAVVNEPPMFVDGFENPTLAPEAQDAGPGPTILFDDGSHGDHGHGH